MDIVKLKELRKAIDEAENLPKGQYVNIWEDSDCFCAVGHMFRIGGMTVEDMCKLEEAVSDSGLNQIDDILDGSNGEELQKLVVNTLEMFGLDLVEDNEFLNELQRVNDSHFISDELRKEKLLDAIDSRLHELQT